MTAPTPWSLVSEDSTGKLSIRVWPDRGPFIVDANGKLIDVRRDGNGQLIVNAVNKLMMGSQ